MADDERPASLKLPATAPRDLDAFLGCTGTSVVLKGGKQAWLGKIDLGVTTIEAPEISFAPGADGGIDLTVGSGMFSLTLQAKVADGKLVVEPPNLPGVADPLKQQVDELNKWFAKNGKKLGAPKIDKGTLTLTKVPLSTAQYDSGGLPVIAPLAVASAQFGTAGVDKGAPTRVPLSTQYDTGGLPVAPPLLASRTRRSASVKAAAAIGVAALVVAGAVVAFAPKSAPPVAVATSSSVSVPTVTSTATLTATPSPVASSAAPSAAPPTLAQLLRADLTPSQQTQLGLAATTPTGTDFLTPASLALTNPNLVAAYTGHGFLYRHTRDYVAIGLNSSNPDTWPLGKSAVYFHAFDAFDSALAAALVADASKANLLGLGYTELKGTFPAFTGDTSGLIIMQKLAPGSTLLGTNFIDPTGPVVIKIASSCRGCSMGKLTPAQVEEFNVERANIAREFGY